MAFVITPDSYVFSNIGESSTFIITTDNDDYKFELVNTASPGNGRVKLDRETNTMTSIAYGRGRYRFIDGDDVYPFNIQVKRPEADVIQDITQYVEIGDTVSVNFKVPDGYTLLRYEMQDLDNSNITIESNNYNPTITANAIGSATVDVILGKIAQDKDPTTGDDETEDPDIDTEDGIEYYGGSITFKIIRLSMSPSDTTVSLLLKEIYEVNSLYLTVDEQGGRDNLTIDTEFDSTQHCFTLDTRNILVNNADALALIITGVSDGQGRITIKYKEQTLRSIDVIVEDKKGLEFPADLKDIKLDYKKSYTISNVFFVDNGVKSNIIVSSSNNAPFTVDVKETTPDSKVYNITITNNAPSGGIGSILIRGEGTTEGQKTVDVKCYKEVLASDIVFEPTSNKISVVLARSYDFTYLYYTNADEIEVEVAKPDLLEYRIGELKNIPMIPSEDPEGEPRPMEFPQEAVLRSLYFIGKAMGKTTVSIKTYVNDRRNLVQQVTFDVNILANDDLPDNIQLINLKTKPMPSGRKKDILIEFPEDSATLVLKEELEEDAFLEQGEGFDAIELTKPTSTSNVELFNEELNETYLFVNNQDKDKGPEIFVSLDNTPDDNKWKNDKTKETINSTISYPNPGEKGFGVGPAPQDIVEAIGLQPYEGCWDSTSDDYGNYYDAVGNTYVFIPKHYIIPKADSETAGKFPYYGMTYEFSWVETDKFISNTIPRCFINNGKVQPGVFVAKYNGGATSESIKKKTRFNTINGNSYVSPRESSASKPSIYRTTGYSETVGPIGDNYYAESVAFPELQELALTHKQDAGATDTGGILLPNVNQLHNMTIFIQTMLSNLSDVHTIASYEKGAKEDVCGKLKDYVAGTLTKRLKDFKVNDKAEVQMYDRMESHPLGETYFLVRNMYHGSNTGDISPEYRSLFSHNGQACGVYDINGGINTPLTGLLVVQDPLVPDNYEIYSLKETADIAELDRLTAQTIEGVNSESVIFKSPLFDLSYYDKVLDITNNTAIKGIKFLNTNGAFTTHQGKDSLLNVGDNVDKLSINSGINFNSLKNGTEGNYTRTYDSSHDYKTCNDKHKNSIFYLSTLSDCENVDQFRRDQFISMFVCNYVETIQESKDGKFDQIKFPSDQPDFTGYRTRVLRLLGRLKYDKKSSSKYLFSRRQCITPK